MSMVICWRGMIMNMLTCPVCRKEGATIDDLDS